MTNENEVLTPDDSRFELPDVDSLYESNQNSDLEPENNEDSIENIDPYGSTTPEVSQEDEVPEDTVIEIDALHQYLLNKGISDTRKIQYEDENGSPIEVDFDSLSKDEQLNIIEELSKPNITDEEIQTIDYLRRNNMTMAEVVDYFSNLRVQQYIQENNISQEKSYKIDEYSDDELYMADLRVKYPNYSQEKLNAKLAAAKTEDDFSEEVAQLREYYKSVEEEQINSQKQQEEYMQQAYTNAIYESINSFNEIPLDYTDDQSDTLEIEFEDKNKSLSYLLDVDAEGKSQLMKDLENPTALVELAWLRTCGADALAGQSKYYKDIISDRNREIARLNKQIEKLKTSNSVVVPSEPKRTSKNSSSPWDNSGLI